jgi:MFS family permease
LSLAMLLSSLDTSIVNMVLPALARDFGATFPEVQWVLVAHLLVVTTLTVGIGRWGDVVGRRRLLLGGLLLHTLAAVASGLAPSLAWLVAARVAQGLGGAIMMVLSLALVGDTVPPHRTGRALGLLGTMSAVGTALGPPLGGFLLAGFGWRAVFLASVPLGLAALLLTRSQVPADRPAPAGVRKGMDLPGTLLLAGALTLYSLAVTVGHGRFGWSNGLLLLAGAVGAALFGWVEARAAAPLLPLAMLRERALGANLVAGALVATVLTTTLVVGPFYLGGGLGLDPARVGLVLSAGPVVAALTAAPAGRLADRYGPQRLTAVGLAAVGAGCSLLALLPATLGVAGYVVPLVIITGGYGLFQTANNTAVMTAIGPERRGLASGMLNLSRNLGRITGAAAMGALFAYGTGTPDLAAAAPEAVAGGMQATFSVAGLLVLVAGVLTSARREESRQTSNVQRSTSNVQGEAFSCQPSVVSPPFPVPVPRSGIENLESRI